MKKFYKYANKIDDAVKAIITLECCEFANAVHLMRMLELLMADELKKVNTEKKQQIKISKH